MSEERGREEGGGWEGERGGEWKERTTKHFPMKLAHLSEVSEETEHSSHLLTHSLVNKFLHRTPSELVL